MNMLLECLCFNGLMEIFPEFSRTSTDTGEIVTVYPKNYAHGFVVLCFVVVMQSFIMNSHEVFIHVHQGWHWGNR